MSISSQQTRVADGGKDDPTKTSVPPEEHSEIFYAGGKITKIKINETIGTVSTDIGESDLNTDVRSSDFAGPHDRKIGDLGGTPVDVVSHRVNDAQAKTRRSIMKSHSSFKSKELSGTKLYLDPVRLREPEGLRADDPNNESTGLIYMIVPSAGGCMWLIAFLAFLGVAVTDGAIFSFGIILREVSDELSLNHLHADLIASTQIGFFFLSMPLTGILIHKFEFRCVAIVGVLIACAGIYCASINDSYVTLVGCYGALAGFGLGVIRTSSLLIVHYYFDRYRAVVSGLVRAGGGFGVATMTLLNINLIKSDGWKLASLVQIYMLGMMGVLALSFRKGTPIPVGFFESFGDVASIDDSVNSASSPLMLSCRCCRKGHLKPVINHDLLDRYDIFCVGSPDYSYLTTRQMEQIESIDSSKEQAQNIHYAFAMTRHQVAGSGGQTWYRVKLRSAIYEPFNFSLLSMAEVQLFFLQSTFFAMGLNIPYLDSIPRAQIRQDYADLLPVAIGLTYIVCTVSLSCLVYMVKIHPAHLSGMGIFIGGAFTLLSGFGREQGLFQFICAVCFGIAAASNESLCTLYYMRVLGLYKLTNVYGVTSVALAIGAFSGTAIGGLLKDTHGNYESTFFFAGFCLITSGLLLLSVRWQKRKTRVYFSLSSVSRKYCRDFCNLFF